MSNEGFTLMKENLLQEIARTYHIPIEYMRDVPEDSEQKTTQDVQTYVGLIFDKAKEFFEEQHLEQKEFFCSCTGRLRYLHGVVVFRCEKCGKIYDVLGDGELRPRRPYKQKEEESE